jgi:diguanylate cyclase (GGDEF)-like protein
MIRASGAALDMLMPMHLWADSHGRVVRGGPTLTKMVGRGDLAGVSIFDLIDIRRPARAGTIAAVLALAGQRIGLALCAAPHLPLRGALVVLPHNGGLILDLSLGLSFARAVAEFALTLNDFSPCDQTVDMLYLHEANRSTMALSRHLSHRLQAARARAEIQALTDPLTGLANRRAMDAEIARCLEDRTPDFALLHIDLDHFKGVNDTLGHAAGDAVLQHVDVVLRHQLRAGDTAARVGGDEFLVLLHDSDDPDHLAQIAARLIAQIEMPLPFRDQFCRVSASVGGVAGSAYAQPPGLDQILGDVDAALYAAKRAGRGRFVLHHAGACVLRRRAGDAPPGGFGRTVDPARD